MTSEVVLDSSKTKKRRRSSSPTETDNHDPIRKSSRPEAANNTTKMDPTNIYGKTGGAYIPPARLRQMQAQITDKSSEAYQRIAWEALKKSIHGFINKVNVSNISDVVRQLLYENIVRGRGLLVRSLLTAQTASPTFTHVFAALVAVVNSKFPQVGELVLKRLINEFRKAFRRNQKDRCLSTARFLAHLVNQKVVHELIVLELLTLLLEQTTDDSVEVAVSVLKECGAMLTRLVPKGVHGVFEHLRRILNEGNCDKRISYMLEVMFQIRRDGWKDHPIVLPDLDLIQEDDQITHTTSLLDQVDPEDHLNVFRFDPDYLANEEKYAQIKASFFESDDDDDDDDGNGDSEGGSDDEDGSDESDEDQEDGERPQGAAAAESTDKQTVIDQTETNLVHLRRTIYLMLQSSLSADEAGHRLLQLKIRPGEEYEVASMVLDCCAQTRSYETRYGRLAQRLCRVILTSGGGGGGGSGSSRPAAPELGPGSRYKPGPDYSSSRSKNTTSEPEVAEDTGPPRSYVAEFEKIFSEQYSIIHRLETAKLRNVALFFAHLFYTDSISWGVLECVRLNERDTTSSGRIFLKHLFLELCSFMGLAKLHARLWDETLQPYFAGLLPRDNPKDTRFAINFFTMIGLGGLTLELREHLQASREAALAKRESQADTLVSDVDDQSSDGSSSSSCSDDSSSSSSEDSDSENDKKRKSKKNKKHVKAKHSHGKRNTGETSPRKNVDSKELEKNIRAKDVHHKTLPARSKERPLDTPFFNDTPNSPTRHLAAPVHRDDTTTRVRSSRPRGRSSPSPNRSPDTSPFSRGGMRSTVTMVSGVPVDKIQHRRNRSVSMSSGEVKSDHSESPVRPGGHRGSRVNDISRRPSPLPTSSRHRRHDDRTPHPHLEKYSARGNSPRRRPEPKSGTPERNSMSRDYHRSSGANHRNRSPHIPTKDSGKSTRDHRRRAHRRSSSPVGRSKSRSPFEGHSRKNSKTRRSPHLSPPSRHRAITAAQS